MSRWTDGLARAAALVGVVGSAVGALVPSTAAADSAVRIADLPPLPEVETQVEPSLLAPPSDDDDLVTGSAKREQSLGNVASAVTVISRDRLRRFGSRTVAEAIATIAGIHLVDDRLSTRVGIRGLQIIGDFNTRILVVIDGTSVTESWSHLSGVGYDLPVSIDEIERIEVIRGPVSAIYGTNAFFGIINIVTRGPGQGSGAWGRVGLGEISGGSAAAGFAFGSRDRQVRGAVSGTLRRGEALAFDGQALGPEMDRGAHLQASLSGAWGNTFAQVRGYIAHRTVPFGPYDSTYADPYVQTNRQLLFDVSHALVWHGVQLSGRLFANLYRFDDRATADVDDALVTIGEARSGGAEVRARKALLEGGLLGVTGGLEASYNDTTSEYVLSDVRNDAGPLAFDLEGLYVEADSEPTAWLGVNAGLRCDRHSAFKADDGIGCSPRAAVFLSQRNLYGLKLLYATGFRYPSTYESRFADGQDFVENEDLMPERIASVEAIAWARPRPTTWLRASVFRWRADEIIKQGETPKAPPGDGSVLQFQNLDNYDTYGLEMEASYRDRLGWYAFAGATLVHVRSVETEAGMRVKARPAGAPWFTGSLGLSSPKLGDVAQLSTELAVIGSRKTRAPSAPSSAFVGWNLAVYVPSWRGFDVTLGVRNLLGQVQDVPAAEDFDRTIPGGSDTRALPVVPGEGRELYVRLGHALR